MKMKYQSVLSRWQVSPLVLLDAEGGLAHEVCSLLECLDEEAPDPFISLG